MSPAFVTFTGVDDWTSTEGMRLLARRYPIEWGVLFSRRRQGVDPRYPGGEMLSRLMWSGLRMSAHLCGSYSDDVMEGRSSTDIPADLSYFERVQVNHAAPVPARIVQFQNGWDTYLRGIAQCRDYIFPANNSVDWLFDRSGGTGVTPDAWPLHPGGMRRVGYAGGIGPDNVLEVISAINCTGPYWLDMESGVRTDDRFDLDKCKAVCRAIWGGRA